MNQDRLQTLVFNDNLVTVGTYVKQIIVTKRYSNSMHLNKIATNMNLHNGHYKCFLKIFSKILIYCIKTGYW